jgi:hypothetical protein
VATRQAGRRPEDPIRVLPAHRITRRLRQDRHRAPLRQNRAPLLQKRLFRPACSTPVPLFGTRHHEPRQVQAKPRATARRPAQATALGPVTAVPASPRTEPEVRTHRRATTAAHDPPAPGRRDLAHLPAPPPPRRAIHRQRRIDLRRGRTEMPPVAHDKAPPHRETHLTRGVRPCQQHRRHRHRRTLHRQRVPRHHRRRRARTSLHTIPHRRGPLQ